MVSNLYTISSCLAILLSLSTLDFNQLGKNFSIRFIFEVFYPFSPFWKRIKGVKLLEKQQSKIGLYIRVLARHSSVTLLESETQVSLACIAGRERHSQVAYFIRFMDLLRWGIQLGIPRVVYLWTYFKLIFLKQANQIRISTTFSNFYTYLRKLMICQPYAWLILINDDLRIWRGFNFQFAPKEPPDAKMKQLKFMLPNIK